MDGCEELRPLGRLERFSAARHHVRFYLGVGVTATYTLPTRDSSLPLKNYVYAASAALIAQHPALSAISVREDTSEPLFVRLPAVPLDDCVFFQSRRCDGPTATSTTASHDADSTARDTELDELLTAQHNTPFTPPSPSWRLCILTEPSSKEEYRFTAVFMYHHVIGDGTSGMAFHRTFHQALCQAVRQPPPNDLPQHMVMVPSPQGTPLLPNVESIHPMPVSLRYLLTALIKEKVWARRDPLVWTGAKVVTPLESRVRHLRFTRASTRALAGLCRANGTTVTAALQTLIAGALFSNLPGKFTKLHCAGALSTRRWLSHKIIPEDADATTDVDDYMGVWVQDFSDEYSRGKFQRSRTLIPWDEARRSRKTIQRELNLQGKNSSPNLLRYVDDYHNALFLSKVGQERDGSFEVSSLGIFRTKQSDSDDSGQAHAEIGQMVFTQGAGVTGPPLGVGAMTGPDGCLALGFAWQKGVVEDSLIEGVMETVRKEITPLGNAEQ